ncbi:hypothetical protein WICMUC_001713 [Wickerhamomyces mucosus]|uniref:Uncharacterized protein n=1 Tax=Wickerhamomyces mucosus TaxID=1378264 RepID=A0A9P8PU29_9ASCO|nr:hypothetical protein WICMUC_001713 [Wickerhamomyces mucosus]
MSFDLQDEKENSKTIVNPDHQYIKLIFPNDKTRELLISEFPTPLTNASITHYIYNSIKKLDPSLEEIPNSIEQIRLIHMGQPLLFNNDEIEFPNDIFLIHVFIRPNDNEKRQAKSVSIMINSDTGEDPDKYTHGHDNTADKEWESGARCCLIM